MRPVLKLRRGVVATAQEGEGAAFQDLEVEVDGERRPAKADVGLQPGEREISSSLTVTWSLV